MPYGPLRITVTCAGHPRLWQRVHFDGKQDQPVVIRLEARADTAATTAVQAQLEIRVLDHREIDGHTRYRVACSATALSLQQLSQQSGKVVLVAHGSKRVKLRVCGSSTTRKQQ